MSKSLSPVRRAARLLKLIRQPITLEALQQELGCSAVQLWRDLKDVKDEGYNVQGQGGGPQQLKSVWLGDPPFTDQSDPAQPQSRRRGGSRRA